MGLGGEDDRGRHALGPAAAARPSRSTCASSPTRGSTRARRRSARRTGRQVERHRPAAHDRLAVGRAPHRARRHAARHRPARVRPAGPAQRVPPRGVPDVRGAPRTSSATASPRRSSGSRVQRQPPPEATAPSPRRWPGAPQALRAELGQRRRRRPRRRGAAGRPPGPRRPPARPILRGALPTAPAARNVTRVARRRARHRRRGGGGSAPAVGRRAARLHADRARASAATTRAGAARAPSTRSATAAERAESQRAPSLDVVLAGSRGRDRGRRLRGVPDLGPGQPRRAARRRRDRRHGRGPVRRPPVTGLRGAARSRHRALPRRRRAAARS